MSGTRECQEKTYQTTMNVFLPCNTLERMAKRSTKLLTLELDLETLAEFSAACEVFGARSKSTFLNQYVVQKIREAKQTVSKEEFSGIYEKQLKEIQERSQRKSLERKQKNPILSEHKGEIDIDSEKKSKRKAG